MPDRQSDDFKQARSEAYEATQRWAAYAHGVVDGILTGLEDEQLPAKLDAALHEAGRWTQETARALHSEAQAPEMQRLGHDIRHGAWVARRRGKEALADGKHEVEHLVDEGRDALERRMDAVRDEVQERSRLARLGLQRWREEAGLYAKAGKESARRAAKLPAEAWHDTRDAAKARLRGAGAKLGLYVGLGIVALTAWITLTAGLVLAFGQLAGAAGGWLIVTGLWALVAVGMYFGAQKAGTVARRRAKAQLDDMKEAWSDTWQPMRAARRQQVHQVPPMRPTAPAMRQEEA